MITSLAQAVVLSEKEKCQCLFLLDYPSDVLTVGKNWSKEKLSTKLEEGTAILKQVYR